MSSSRTEYPRATRIQITDDELVAELEDGRVISVPLDWFPTLRSATPDQRKNFRLIGRGVGINWPELDEDLSVRGLLMPDARPLSRPIRESLAPDSDDGSGDDEDKPISEDQLQ